MPSHKKMPSRPNKCRPDQKNALPAQNVVQNGVWGVLGPKPGKWPPALITVTRIDSGCYPGSIDLAKKMCAIPQNYLSGVTSNFFLQIQICQTRNSQRKRVKPI